MNDRRRSFDRTLKYKLILGLVSFWIGLGLSWMFWRGIIR